MKKINHYQGDTLDFHKDVVNSKRNTANDKNKKNRLAALLPTSRKAFVDYDDKFTRNSLNGLKIISLTKQEKEDFIGLYNFQSPIFTHLFNQLTTSEDGIDNSLCPYCTIGEASSLDHIVPKTVMPVFSDNPKNLIPCCSNCNSKKSNTWLADGNWDYINLYLDDIPTEQYLFVELSIENNTIRVKFYLDDSNSIDKDLYLKISNHYKKLDLCRRFEQYSFHEISETAILIKQFSKLLGNDKCKEIILATSIELQNRFGSNYWKAILRKECCMNDSIFQLLKNK